MHRLRRRGDAGRKRLKASGGTDCSSAKGTISLRNIEVSDGRIHGDAVEVPVLEAPGQTRIGHFGAVLVWGADFLRP
jgi:hypothetical protein